MNIRRIEEATNLILKKDYSIREVAKQLCLSKSTIHKDIQCYLKEIDENKYQAILKVFKNHQDNWHLKGGAKTKLKYAKDKDKISLKEEY